MALWAEEQQPTNIHLYQFTSTINNIQLHIKFECEIKLLWKASSGKIINDQLSIQQHLTLTNGLYQSKITKFVLLIYSTKGNKQAGEFLFDLSTILNHSHLRNQPLKFKLDRCPDQNAYVTIQVNPRFIRQTTIQQYQQPTINKSKSLNHFIPLEKCDFKKKNKPMETQANIKSPLKQINLMRHSLNGPINTVAKLQSQLNSIKLYKLQNQNKSLKKEYKKIKEQELRNKQLKKQVIEYENKLQQKHNYQLKEIQNCIKQYKIIYQSIQNKYKFKSSIEMELYQSKQKMAKILNFTIANGLESITDQLFNIFQFNT